MEAKTITFKNSFWLRPFQFEGTAMHANVLLMCKLLVVLLFAHHFFAKIQDPFIPFIPALDLFHAIPNVFKIGLRSLLVLSTFTLFFNIYVRTSAIIIGCIIILQILSSKPSFYNHNFICGCALFLAGLSNNKQPPYLLIIQLCLVYFGASINKILDVDWWTGAFMHNWLGVARENPVYLTISDWFPKFWFAKFLSYTAFSTELFIAVLLCFKKYRSFGVWFIVIFHTLLFTMTSFRFGHFIESLAIILLAFLVFPKDDMIVDYKKGSLKLFKKIIQFFDWDKKIKWNENDNQDYLISLTAKGETKKNDKAIKDILLYLPSFYIVLMGCDIIIYIILYYHRTTLFVLNALVIWTLIIYFLPVPWLKLFSKKSIYK